MSLSEEILAEFSTLLAEAERSGDPEPRAMNVATVDATGRVHSRTVLLKGLDARGVRFYTNYQSHKGDELAQHAGVALCVHWKHVRDGGVQVRVEGVATKTSAQDSDAYFATRPRGSQIGAWASHQSQTLPDRATFEARIAQVEAEYAGRDVPRPPHWGGYLVVPDVVEFWYGAKFRLHERQRYQREGDAWTRRMLYP